ncbi:MAG: DUF4389 domain-containing protein [Dehalococcoidia bacterium]
MQTGITPYPVNFDVPYPEGPRDRKTVGLRIFWVIPIAIVLGFVSGGGGAGDQAGDAGLAFGIGAGGIVTFGVLLMIVFRQKYPKWWWDWNLQLTRFSNRVTSYALLLRDEYPATDDDQAVRFEMPYPDVPTELNRWLPLVKWFLAIPHYIVLIFLFIGVIVVTIISWFAILFTGQHPRGLHGYTVGVMRWGNRVTGYAFLLVTDQYPPFRLQA